MPIPWAVIAQAGAAVASQLMNSNSDAAGAASARQYAMNYALQKDQQAYNTYMYKHRYQMQVEDLEKAGINKLYGLGTAPAVTSGLNSVGMPDMVGEKNGKMQNAIAMMGLAQDFSAKRAEIKKIEQETKTEQQNTELTRLNVLQQAITNGNLNEKQKAEIDNLISQTNQNIKNLSVMDSQISVNKSAVNLNNENARDIAQTRGSRIQLNKAQATNARANAISTQQNTQMMKDAQAGQVEVQKNTADFMKKHPQVAKVVGAANALGGITGQVLGAAGITTGAYVAGKGAGKQSAASSYRKSKR